MPYAQDTVRMTLEGTIYGVQSWSTGLWFGTSGFPTGATYGIDQMNGLRDSSDLQGFITTFVSTVQHQITAKCQVNQVRYAVYSGVGHTPNAESVWVPNAPLVGNGGASLPSECALVASLRTNTPGGSGRGRSYLPLLYAAIDATRGGTSIDDAETVAGAYATLMSSINAHPFDSNIPAGTPYNLYASLASYKLGTNHPLTKVQVDTRIDSQRRREDKLPFLVATSSL